MVLPHGRSIVHSRLLLMVGFQDPQQHAVDMLLAEVDVYEMFYFKHCQGRKVQIALCEGIPLVLIKYHTIAFVRALVIEELRKKLFIRKEYHKFLV